MNNYNSIFLIFFLLLVSCGSVKDAFTTNKGTKTEEFLVEKKSPLIMPPDYGDLPTPKENKENLSNQNEVQSLLIKSENKQTKSKKSMVKSLEEDLLEKIKDN